MAAVTSLTASGTCAMVGAHRPQTCDHPTGAATGLVPARKHIPHVSVFEALSREGAMDWVHSWTRVLLALPFGVLAGCGQQADKYFQRTNLPDQVVPLYNEVAAFKSRAQGKPDTTSVRRRVPLDLKFLVKDSEARRAV